MPNTFEELRGEDRTQLLEARASEWRGALTEEQFAERNKRLYRHPYGTKIRTYALKDESGAVLSSLDRLPISLRRWQDGKTTILPGEILASVVTPKALRGKGYAQQMMKHYVASLGERTGVLYSDIGPEFYAKLGYRPFPRVECEIPLVRVTTEWANIESAPVSEVHQAMDTARNRFLKKTEGDAFCIEPDPFFLDWQLERFHFFAQIAGVEWDGLAGWRIANGDVFFAAPDAITDSLCCLWSESPVENILGPLANLASKFGLSQIRAWMPVGRAADGGFEEPKIQCPMVRMPGNQESEWVDIQWCDWW